jgi:hypothetical protein
MLCIKTKIANSEISGIGLFADQDIKKGTVVWKYQSKLDLLYSESDIAKLSSEAQKQFHNYAFLDPFHNKFMLCGDDARFFNHSDHPNCNDALADITIAERDIKKGEELTVNYKTFYGDLENHPEIISESEIRR